MRFLFNEGKKGHTVWNIKICEDHVFQDTRERLVVGKTATVVGYYQLRYKHGKACRAWSRCRLVPSSVREPCFLWWLGGETWGFELCRMVTGSIVQCEVSRWGTTLLWLAYCISILNGSFFILIVCLFSWQCMDNET